MEIKIKKTTEETVNIELPYYCRYNGDSQTRKYACILDERIIQVNKYYDNSVNISDAVSHSFIHEYVTEYTQCPKQEFMDMWAEAFKALDDEYSILNNQ